jgi:hypothetical protein
VRILLFANWHYHFARWVERAFPTEQQIGLARDFGTAPREADAA